MSEPQTYLSETPKIYRIIALLVGLYAIVFDFLWSIWDWTVFVIQIAMLASILVHGYRIGTWASSGENPHLIIYSIGAVLLSIAIYKRNRYIWRRDS